MPETSNPYDELEALLAGIQAAVAGVVLPNMPRAAVVTHREPDGDYGGTFPWIKLAPFDYRLDRLMPGIKGQDGQMPSLYAVELHDVVDPRGSGTQRVADAQTTLLLLIKAIGLWFDTRANQCLANTVEQAGEYLRFQFRAPFAQSSDGDIHVVAAGTISVRGIRHRDIRP